MENERTGVVIVAAGRSQRMGGTDKLFIEINGEPLFGRLINVFDKILAIDEIVIVVNESNMGEYQRLAGGYNWSKVSRICIGGSRRQDSVRAGLQELTDCELVIIHDGARPLVDQSIIETGLSEAQKHGAAVAAVPVKDTIKTSSSEGFIQDTPQRDHLWAVQTPQIFRFDLIQQAHREVPEDVSDDAMMVEKLGYPVKLFMGSYRNIKITTPEDLSLAELILGSS